MEYIRATARQDLTLVGLVGCIAKSRYLFDPKHDQFVNDAMKQARWEEIALEFKLEGRDASGLLVYKHWVKYVARYKNVLRELLIAVLRTGEMKPEKFEHIGRWFDLVGRLVGVTLDELFRRIKRTKSVEENFLRMYRLV